MAETVEDKRQFTLRSPGPFKATKLAAADGSNQYFLEGIASSTVQDRQGDVMDAACQSSMLNQAKGLTMWLNHSYNIPEDILGTCQETTLESRYDTKSAETVIDLCIRVEVDPTNDRAMKVWRSVERGTKLGFSIGGAIRSFDFETKDNGEMPGMVIHDIELFEISCVGIPANPRAYAKFLGTITDSVRKRVLVGAPTLVAKSATDPEARERLRQYILRGFVMPEEVTKANEENIRDAEQVNDAIAAVESTEDAEVTAASDAAEEAKVTVEPEEDEKIEVEALDELPVDAVIVANVDLIAASAEIETLKSAATAHESLLKAQLLEIEAMKAAGAGAVEALKVELSIAKDAAAKAAAELVALKASAQPRKTFASAFTRSSRVPEGDEIISSGMSKSPAQIASETKSVLRNAFVDQDARQSSLD